MSTTGINYFINTLNLRNQLQVMYDFKESGVTAIPSVNLANALYSGTIITNNLNYFWSKSGSGLFSHSLININNVSGLNKPPSWTMSIVYESLTGQHGVLFSSYTAGAINSGFTIGISNSCQPYIEYYTNSGPAVWTSNNNYGTKNGILITKSPGQVSVDYLNFNSKILESETFPVSDSYFLWSDRCHLGGSTGSPSYFSGNNFSGYMDNFLFFTPGLTSSQKTAVFSGIYCDYVPPVQQITSGITTAITGYSVQTIPIFSGITGQANEFYNYLTGSCGNITATYIVTGVTGIIYDTENLPTVQTIVNYYTGVTGGFLVENTGYSSSFGMDGITYLKNIDNNDLTEFFYYPNVNKTNINNNLSWDRINNKYLLGINNYTTDSLNFYVDSIAQFGSGYSVGGNYYNPTAILSGMYFISGIYLSGLYYDNLDTNILDVVNGPRQIVIGANGISGITWSTNNMIFADGVKLKSGIDFQVNGAQIILLNGNLMGAMGQYWTFPIDAAAQFISGINNYFNTPSRFARGASQVFMNGLRESLLSNYYTSLNLINDYIEVSKFSPLNNTSNFINQLQTLYFNDNSWIESL